MEGIESAGAVLPGGGIAMARTSPKRARYIELSNFLGVDFANEETEVDVRRSPYAPNMVADRAGRPEKRVGYKQICSYEGRINGIHFFDGEMIVHAGTNFYDAEGNLLYEGANDARSVSFVMALEEIVDEMSILHYSLYIMDGANYLCYDGENLKKVDGYIPTTKAAGMAYEPSNLIQPKRINCFMGNGRDVEFQLDGRELDNAQAIVYVEGQLKTAGVDYTLNAQEGTITFVSAPPATSGNDNISVQFTKTIAGYYDMIGKCRTYSTFGVSNDARVFVTGNPDHPNRDWQSGTYNPEYFPDTGYTNLGSSNAAIMGYIKQYDSMIVVKEPSDEAGLFLRNAQVVESEKEGATTHETIFEAKEGISGVGAISRYAFASLGNDQLMLTRNGVCGLSTNAVSNQKSVINRSFMVNPQLTKEKNLSEAVAAVWGRFYVLSVNGVCYVANTEQTCSTPSGTGYEWYYWTDIPARVLREHGGKLYFGTEDGKVMCFRDPEEEGRFAYSDNGAPINSVWTTALLDGGNFMREKSISKKGTGVLVKPYTRSSGEIYFTTDKTLREVTSDFTVDIFDFDDVDFNRFTFDIMDGPRVQVSPRKFRKVLQFQMGVRNNEADQGFGILAMMISFTMGNLTRRKNGGIKKL